MASTYLTNTYRQYKADTKQFVTWLVTTAKEQGWTDAHRGGVGISDRPGALKSEDEVQEVQGTSSSKAKNKKSQQKKKKERQARAASRYQAGSEPAKYLIPVADFEPLAKFVASSSKAQAKIPGSVAQMLDRVIALREAFANILAQRMPDLEVKRVKSHSHFLHVLKQVRMILSGSPDAGVLPNLASLKITPKEQARQMAGIYSALHVYEPSQAFLDLPDVAFPSAEYDVEEEEDTSEQDAYIAFTSLLQDVLNLRSEVNKLWEKRYCAGTLHLSPAGIASNTAIDLARQMEEDLTTTINKAGGTGKLLLDNYRRTCSSKALDPDAKEKSDDDINLETYDIANGTMFEAYHLLDKFRRRCAAQGDNFVPYNGEHGWYDPKQRSRRKDSDRTKYDRDKAALFETLSDIFILIRKLNWNGVEDELTRGVRLMLDTHTIPFWLVFAAQMFLDNLKLMGATGLDSAFADVVNIGRWIENCMNNALDFVSTLDRPDAWPVGKDNMLRQLAEKGPFFDDEHEEDRLGPLKKKLLPGISRPASTLIHRNAVFAGVWAHHLLTQFHTIGIEFTNAWGAVFGVAQLYHAARMLSKSAFNKYVPEFLWPDMEVMQGWMQGNDRFWIGDAPKELEQLFRHWCLCQGMSVSNFKKGTGLEGQLSASGLHHAVRGGKSQPRRGLVVLCPVSMMFKGRLGTDSHDGIMRVNMTLEDVQKIVAASEWKEADAEDRLYEDSVFEMVQEWEFSGARRYGSTLPSQTPPTGTEHMFLSPAQLIARLGYAIEPEQASLYWDYFHLHDWTWRLLKSLRRIVDKDFRRLLGPGYIESEMNLPDLIGLIFRAAAGMVPGMKPEDRLSLLESASVGVQNFVGVPGGGSLVITELRKLRIDIEFQAEYE